MYAALRPRLGVFHFTLAIVFFPFGAPQAQSVPTRVPTAVSVPAPSVAPPIVASATRQIGARAGTIGDCIAHSR